MKWFAKIVNWIIGVGILAYLITALSFSSSRMDGQKITALSVEIQDLNQVDFVGEEDIQKVLEERKVKLLDLAVDSVNKAYVREIITDMPHVQSSEIYFTPDGVFHIKLWQRIPVMRVLSGSNDFYVDEYGEVFPVSLRHTSKVPVFTGSIDREMIHDGLLKMALFLNENAFWGAMIDQVQVNDMQNIELVTKVAAHRVLFGEAAGVEWKFTKLKAVYDKALPVTGWEAYKSIDLRFGDQVICKK